MMCMGSSDEGCGGRWLKALAGRSHRFLLDGDSFQALYGRFFSGLICSLSYFSHFLWLIYHCFEFFLWDCSQQWISANGYLWCVENDSVFSLIHYSDESISGVYKYFFKTFFSECINHSVGHRDSFKGMWAFQCPQFPIFSGTHGSCGAHYSWVNLGSCMVFCRFLVGGCFGVFSFVGDMTQNLKQNWWETCKPTGISIETRKKNAFSDPCEAILLN